MSQTQKLIIQQIHEMLTKRMEKQESIQNEISLLHKKLDELNKPKSPEYTEPENHNAVSLIQYFEDNYGQLKKLNKQYIQEETFRFRKRKMKTWRSTLNERKLAYFNAIKNREMAKIYENFLKQNEIYIPRKMREKITPHDSEQQKNIKMELNITKLQAHIKILEDKAAQHTTKYLTLDEELHTLIHTICPEELQHSLLELWSTDCKKEEEKSSEIVEKKKQWLVNLPSKEKQLEERKIIQEQTDLGATNQPNQQNNRSSDNPTQFSHRQNTKYPNRGRNHRHNYIDQNGKWKGRKNNVNRKYSSFHKPKHANRNTHGKKVYHNNRQHTTNKVHTPHNGKQLNNRNINKGHTRYNKNQNNVSHGGNMNRYKKNFNRGPNRNRNHFLEHGNGGRNST